MVIPRSSSNCTKSLEAAAQAPPADATKMASVEGLVLNQVTKAPIKRVEVRLFRVEKGPISMGSNDAAYSTVTDAEGKFRIEGVEPGEYSLEHHKGSFVSGRGSRYSMIGSTLKLAAGEKLGSLRYYLTPQAIVSGRLFDDEGEPVEHAMVMVLGPVHGRSVVSLGGPQGGPTNDRGEYRIPGAPGKYYVSARPQGRLAFLDGTAQVAATYYPSAGNKGGAEVVVTKPGSEVSGIDIQLTQATRQQVFSIRGVVKGAGSEQATVRLQTLDGAGRNTGSRMRIIGADGKFWFDKLAPGGYRLSASGSSGATWLFSAPADLKLDGADIANLVLVLEPGGELAGTLETVGMAPGPPPPGKLTVRLAPVVTGGFAEETTADVDAKGAFRLSGVAPGRFRIQVDGLPENACVASVVLDGKAASDGLFDVPGEDDRPGSAVPSTAPLAVMPYPGVTTSIGSAPLRSIVSARPLTVPEVTYWPIVASRPPR